MPEEPPATSWLLPDPSQLPDSGGSGAGDLPGAGSGAGAGDLIGVGADLEPGTLLSAYRLGLFPMPVRRRVVGWWSPDPRGILPLDGLKVSKSLRRSCRRFTVTVDTAFDEVVVACSDPRRPHGWITPDIRKAYRRLFTLGWAHSVEAWSDDDGALAGGLYGVAIGGLFAGESMFHRRTDASKAALVALVDMLRGDDDADDGRRLLDVQWLTPHLASLGAVAVRRSDYLARLRTALAATPPPALA